MQLLQLFAYRYLFIYSRRVSYFVYGPVESLYMNNENLWENRKLSLRLHLCVFCAPFKD